VSDTWTGVSDTWTEQVLCDDAGMRTRIHAIGLPSEISDFSDEVRQVFNDLGRVFGPESLAGECSPPVDVYETDDSIEIAVDLPGVEAATVRVISKGDAILIVGEKPSRRVRGESSFHLVERGYGRFARALRVTRACDMSRARAALQQGELRIWLPKIADRRGRPLQIKVNTITTA
jgi:HSP20 family protein